MAKASDLIGFAYREANFKGIINTLSADESREGLTLLQGLSDSLFGMIVGTRLTAWFIPRPQMNSNVAARGPIVGDMTPKNLMNPPSNTRLMMKNTSDEVIYFQFQPEDGAIMAYADVGHSGQVTLDANGALFGLSGTTSQVEIDSAAGGRNRPRTWMYRADYGSWVEVAVLTQESEMPYPSIFDDYFVTALAIRLSPRFGNDPRQATVLRYKDMQTFIRGQWLQSRSVLVGNAGTPTDQAYGAFAAGDDFNTGGRY